MTQTLLPSLRLRCAKEALAYGYNERLGLLVLDFYIKDRLIKEHTDQEFEEFFNECWEMFCLPYESNDNLHQVFTEIHNAVKQYLTYVKNVDLIEARQPSS